MGLSGFGSWDWVDLVSGFCSVKTYKVGFGIGFRVWAIFIGYRVIKMACVAMSKVPSDETGSFSNISRSEVVKMVRSPVFS